MTSHQVSDDFFMCWAEGKVQFPVASLHFEVEQHVSEGFSTARAFENLDGLQCRHEQFDRAGSVHFFADDF